MSILIKGMTMPIKKNGTVIIVYPDGRAFTSDEKLQAVELPPHGRLIDGDALMGVIQDYIEEYSDLDEDGMHNLKWCAMKETEMAINTAPTIVEADNNTQNMSAESEEEDA